MKQPIIYLLSILVLTSCSQELLRDEVLTTNIQVEDISHMNIDKMSALQNYIQSTHPHVTSRNITNELMPITYLGDTVAYVMNFSQGWEMYSNSLSMPMLLMKSDTGYFDSDLLESNPSLNAFFELSQKALYSEKNDVAVLNDIDIEWNVYASNQISSVNSVFRKPVLKQTYNVGMSTYIEKSDTIEHLIQTKWDQDYPYNAFCPYVKDTNNTKHALAGCAPVAAAQFLYYTHYNFGKPVCCFSTPTYIEDSNTYTFHNSSTTIWDEMPLYSYYNTNPALLIGYAGKEMNTSYGTDTIGRGSSTTNKNFISYLNREAGISLSYKSFSSSDVYDCLENNKPVPSSIYGNSTTQDNTKKVGHMIIFDHCIRDQWIIEYYRAELPEDPGYGARPPQMTREQAEHFYGKIEITRVPGNTRYYFKANWGWGPYASDPSINGALLEVTSGGYTFDEINMMIY